MNTNSYNLEKRIEDIEKNLELIFERNKKVEANKAWETSWSRKITIILITYIFMTLVFNIIKVEEPHINAIIPTLGYFLSTQSFPLIKRIWINRLSSNLNSKI